MAEATPFVIGDKRTPAPSERSDENLLQVLGVFDRLGRDRLPGNLLRADFEAEAMRRGLV